MTASAVFRIAVRVVLLNLCVCVAASLLLEFLAPTYRGDLAWLRSLWDSMRMGLLVGIGTTPIFFALGLGFAWRRQTSYRRALRFAAILSLILAGPWCLLVFVVLPGFAALGVHGSPISGAGLALLFLGPSLLVLLYLGSVVLFAVYQVRKVAPPIPRLP
jgi:hypothetical protein